MHLMNKRVNGRKHYCQLNQISSCQSMLLKCLIQMTIYMYIIHDMILIYLYVAYVTLETLWPWPHMFWPQPHKNVWPHTSWPWPHPPLASLTSLAWTYCSAETLLCYCSPFRYIVNKQWKLHTQDSWGSGLDWQLPISCRSETAARHTSCDRTTKRTATISPHIHIRTFLHTYICIYLLKNTAEQHG